MFRQTLYLARLFRSGRNQTSSNESRRRVSSWQDVHATTSYTRTSYMTHVHPVTTTWRALLTFPSYDTYLHFSSYRHILRVSCTSCHDDTLRRLSFDDVWLRPDRKDQCEIERLTKHFFKLLEGGTRRSSWRFTLDSLPLKKLRNSSQLLHSKIGSKNKKKFEILIRGSLIEQPPLGPKPPKTSKKNWNFN